MHDLQSSHSRAEARGGSASCRDPAEILKALLHRGRQPDLKHYRESRGVEIDIIVQQSGTLTLVECKSGATIHPSFLDPLSRFRDLLGLSSPKPAVETALVYGGTQSHPRRTIPLFSWNDIDRLCRRIAASEEVA